MYYYNAKVNERHVGRSGERAMRWPWGYFGDADELFGWARERAAEV